MNSYGKGRFRRQYRYELLLLVKNWFIPFFGLAFPLLLSVLISFAVLKDLPAAARPMARVKIVLQFLPYLPLAIAFLGHLAVFSQETEKEIPLRLELFGIPQRVIIPAKVAAELTLTAAAGALFFLIHILFFHLQLPSWKAFHILWITGLMAAGLILLSHGIVMHLQKFERSYAAGMALYFFFLLTGGMMGFQTDQMPKAIQMVGGLFPFYYTANNLPKLWSGERMHFMPLLQAYLFFFLLSVLIILWAVRRKDRSRRRNE